MSNVIQFPRKLRLVQCDDVRVEFARPVEERFYAMVNMAEGKLPARFCEDVRPSDTED